MIKKSFAILLCILFTFTLASCGLVRPATVVTRPATESTSEPETEKGSLQSAEDSKDPTPSVDTEDKTDSVNPTETIESTETAEPTETTVTTEEVTVPETTVTTEFQTLVPPVIPAPEPGAPKTICIDAGHGYVDPGCTTEHLNGAYERDIVAEYADLLAKKLEAEGYRVIMLHTEDKYVTAEEVIAAANSLGMTYKPDKIVDDGRFAAYNRTVWANVLHRETYIDLFISLHIDNFPANADVSGTRIYYCSNNNYTEQSGAFVTALTEGIMTKVKDQRASGFALSFDDAYIVTKHTDMPSALVEIGFASNKAEAENILDEDWRESFVDGLVDGVDKYFG